MKKLVWIFSFFEAEQHNGAGQTVQEGNESENLGHVMLACITGIPWRRPKKTD